MTGLDYAVNRHYDPQQGRFTQVDPAGMNATSLGNPQSFNLYSYCSNDPINRIDPDGLGILSFIAKIYRAVKKILKWVAIVVAVVFVVALMFAVLNLPGAQFLADVFWKGLGLLLKFMAKTGIMHFAEAGGGLTVGLTGQIVGAAMTVGAIANHLEKGPHKKKKEPIVAISIDIATRQVTELTQKELDKINEEIKKEREYQKCVDEVERELDHKVQRTHEKAIENAESIMYGGVTGGTITSPTVLIGTGIAILLGQRSLARDIESINNSRIAEIKKRCGTR